MNGTRYIRINHGMNRSSDTDLRNEAIGMYVCMERRWDESRSAWCLAGGTLSRWKEGRVGYMYMIYDTV